jgi:hypothetical protein
LSILPPVKWGVAGLLYLLVLTYLLFAGRASSDRSRP